MRRMSRLGSAVGVALAAALAGCGGPIGPGSGAPSSSGGLVTPGASESPGNAPLPTERSRLTTGTLPAELAGTFAARIDPAVVSHADEAGDWFLTFTVDHGYALGRIAVGRPENTGDLTIGATTMTFSGEIGPGACVPPGRYGWATVDGSLVLTTIDDACTVRVNQWVHQPWTPCPGDPSTCAAVLK